jgi:oligosaccharide repeat unit polymerase
MSTITPTGFLALFIIFIYVIKVKGKIYLLPTKPIFFICFSYYSFFGSYSNEVDISFESNLYIFYSFVIFLLIHFLVTKLSFQKTFIYLKFFLNAHYDNSKEFLKGSKFRNFFFFVLFYCIVDFWVNVNNYGSIEAALLRFYVGEKVDSSSNLISTILGFVLQFIMIFIFIFRYYQNIYGKYNYWLYLIVLMIVIISFSKGSRGTVVEPITMILFADVFAMARRNAFSLKKRISEYSILVAASIFLVFSLTFIRGIKFSDFSDFRDVMSSFELKQGTDEFKKGETDLMISDADFIFKNYGSSIEYLGLTYTLGTILVNPIPRAIFHQKPIAFGVILAEAKHGNRDFTVQNLLNVKVGFAAGVAGEGYANLGHIGIIVYSLIFGFYSGFFSKLFYYCMHSNNYLLLIFAFFSFRASYNFIRGDLHTGVTQGIYPIILTFIFALLFTRK